MEENSISDVISIYMELAKKLQKLSLDEQYNVLNQVQSYFEEQADTELGDFLNDIAFIYCSMLYDKNLEDIVTECIMVNDCNYDMLYQVGHTICSF
jgi:hypothetical protein